MTHPSTQETAQRLCKTPRAVLRLYQLGKLEGEPHGRGHRFTLKSIERYAQTLPYSPYYTAVLYHAQTLHGMSVSTRRIFGPALAPSGLNLEQVAALTAGVLQALKVREFDTVDRRLEALVSLLEGGGYRAHFPTKPQPPN